MRTTCTLASLLLVLSGATAWAHAEPAVATGSKPAPARLNDAPRFNAILADDRLGAQIWGEKTMGTPYRDKLSVEERIAGLSLFWSEARQNFVHFAHVPALDWNRTYLEYLPKVMAAETTRDYYRVLMQLAPLLQDGHTNIYPPQELMEEFYARPPLTTALVEQRVLVDRVASPALAKRVHVGDEIIAIDGVPVHEYAEQRVAPFVSASTPQDRALRMYSYQLLSGAAATPLHLQLRAANGAEREETVARSGYADIAPRPQGAFKMLPGDIAYIELDQFETDVGVQAYKRALPQILKAKSLILDVRRNGGGSSEYGLEILSYLSAAPIVGAISYQRSADALKRARSNNTIVSWTPADDDGPYIKQHEQVFTGPVAVLIGPRSFSAAEDFLVAYESMQRGITVGMATGGSTGQPMMFALPGGGKARICVKLDLLPNGREFVGKGIAPTIEVLPTVADLRAGRDATLERAVTALRSTSEVGKR